MIASRFVVMKTSSANMGTAAMNALGLNGAAGNAAARDTFQAGPGFEWTRDNAIIGSNRAAAAAGMGASGNALIAAQDRAANVANQEWGGWLDRVLGVSQQGQQAAGQTANALTNLGGLYQNTTDQRLGLNNTFTSGLIGANNQYAQGKEAQNAGLAGLGQSLGGLTGKFLGFL